MGEAIHASDLSVSSYETTWRHTQEGCHLHFPIIIFNLPKYVLIWALDNFCWMVVVFPDFTSLPFDRQWTRLGCIWSVLFWLRRFLEIKSGRSELTHCGSTPFVPCVWIFVVGCILNPLKLYAGRICNAIPSTPWKCEKSAPTFMHTVFSLNVHDCEMSVGDSVGV
jgi:hypothetical protein